MAQAYIKVYAQYFFIGNKYGNSYHFKFEKGYLLDGKVLLPFLPATNVFIPIALNGCGFNVEHAP